MPDDSKIVLSLIDSFEWDKGNLTKNKAKHQVDSLECEQVFYNNPFYFPDETHSRKEKRYAAYGITNLDRRLVIVFTIRDNKIRVISARDQNKKERIIYEKNKENSSI